MSSFYIEDDICRFQMGELSGHGEKMKLDRSAVIYLFLSWSHDISDVTSFWTVNFDGGDNQRTERVRKGFVWIGQFASTIVKWKCNLPGAENYLSQSSSFSHWTDWTAGG